MLGMEYPSALPGTDPSLADNTRESPQHTAISNLSTRPPSNSTLPTTSFDLRQAFVPQFSTKHQNNYPPSQPLHFRQTSPTAEELEYPRSPLRSLCPPAYKSHQRHRAHSVSGSDCEYQQLRGTRRASYPIAKGVDREDRKTATRTRSLNRGLAVYEEHWRAEDFEPGLALVVETDPQNTTALWKQVKMPIETRSRTGHSDPRSVSRLAEEGEELELSDTKPCKPYDKDFDVKVLRPRAITIDWDAETGEPHVHFDVEEPAPSMTKYDFYTKDRKARPCNLWVEDDQLSLARIADRYQLMRSRNMRETAFASYARERILKQDDTLLDHPSEREWQTERMDELIAKPDGRKWAAPPLVGDQWTLIEKYHSEYQFDLRPDCAYWLSTRGFNDDYQQYIDNHVYIIYANITCPYFTIEFKKDNYTVERAYSQVAAAASLALYNRFLLRKRRLEYEGKPWTAKLTKVLRHYGLTLKGPEYTVWCIEPSWQGSEWGGCQMSRIGHGYCDKQKHVKTLIHWINEIHYWGLAVHVPRCEKDVKLLMLARPKKGGSRVSDVQHDSEDEDENGSRLEAQKETRES